MSLLQLSGNSLLVNLAIFAVVSIVIWIAGMQLQRAADALSFRTGLQRAFVGVLLLSAATSLPETASSISAARVGDVTLAVHALMGATMTQMSLLVIADIVACRRGALTHLSPQFLLLFQGVGLVMLIVMAIAGMAAGPIVILHSVDMWVFLILLIYVAIIYLSYRMQSFPRWEPIGSPAEFRDEDNGEVCIVETSETVHEEDKFRGRKLSSIITMFAGSAIVVLAAGWMAAIVAEELSVQTGLGASFIGVTLLAFATSTPEMASVISSSRQGTYSLAFSNIFGTNMYNIFLLVLVEIFYTRGNIFQEVHRSAIFAGAVSAMITCIYLWGLLEHENRTVFRLGLDSTIVLILFVGGYYVLYLLR